MQDSVNELYVVELFCGLASSPTQRVHLVQPHPNTTSNSYRNGLIFNGGWTKLKILGSPPIPTILAAIKNARVFYSLMPAPGRIPHVKPKVLSVLSILCADKDLQDKTLQKRPRF